VALPADGTPSCGTTPRRWCLRLFRLDVALKVLPAALNDDHDRIARFQREAEVLAQPDHPNIAPIFVQY